MEIIQVNRTTFDIWDERGRLAEVLHMQSVVDVISYVVNKYKDVPVTMRDAE